MQQRTKQQSAVSRITQALSRRRVQVQPVDPRPRLRVKSGIRSGDRLFDSQNQNYLSLDEDCFDV